MALYINSETIEIAMMEENPQELSIFNANSRNAILMATDYIKGFDGIKNYFEGNKGGYRRDAGAALVSNSLGRLQEISPKLNRASTYVESVSNITKMGYSTDEYSRMIATAHSTDMIEDYVNLGLGVAANVISANANVTLDVTGETTKTLTYSALTRAKAKFGDKGTKLQTVVMHSKPFYDLLGESAASANSSFFDLLALTIVSDVPQFPGLVFVITDSPNLVVTGVPDTYITLILGEGGLVVSESEATILNVDNSNLDNSELAPLSHFQYTPKVTLKGYSYTGGIDNPTDAQVFASGNWTKIATDDKLTAGVAIITQ